MGKPTKPQQALMERTKDSPLQKAYEDGITMYSLQNGGKVRQDVAENCIRLGLVKPMGDGLFGDSQLFVAEG